jgi:hypothetical protein
LKTPESELPTPFHRSREEESDLQPPVSITSPAVFGSWRPPVGPAVLPNASERTEDTSPEVFWIDTQGTGIKDRSARELERSAQLFQHKLQKVELNKRAENIQNPRARASYIAGVERRIDFEDTEFVRSINNQRALCEQADVAFTRSDGMCLVLL